MKTFRIPLRVVFYKEAESWIAHCLEFDLCGDGLTKEDAAKSLDQSIRLQIEASVKNNNPRNLFSPAASEIQERFFAGKHTAEGELRITLDSTDHVIFEPPDYREYSDDPADSDSGRVFA